VTLVGLATIGRPSPALADPAATERYAGWSLIEVDVPSDDALAQLLALGVDPWTDHPRPGLLRVLASPAQQASIAATRWSTRTLVADAQLPVDDERERLSLRPPPQGGASFFADFRDLAEIDAQLDASAADNPELATVVELGDSLEGRAIRGLRITADGDDDRPTLLITGGQHAREWIAVSSAMYIADQLITRAGEPMYADALSQLQIVIVPVVNPDGYAFTWTDQRYWRKNRRDGVGVDVNRNFGHGWGGEGASAVPEDENYAGTAAFSEPESQAVRDYVLAHPELVGHLDLHSFGELVLYPWGDVYEVAPDDLQLAATANAAASAMSTNGREYTALQGVNLYPASGNVIDWTYGEADLHALTFELRPGFEDEDGDFVIGSEHIVPCGDEALAGLWVLIDWADADEPEPTTGDGSSSSSGGSSSEAGDGSSSSTAADGSSSSAGPSTTAAGSSSGDADSSGTASPADAGGDGCGCAQHRERRGGVIALVAITLLARRRRR
jgi:zinc carboxypeptidase